MSTITKPVPVRIPAGMMARVDQLRVPVPCEAYLRWLLDRASTAKERARERGERDQHPPGRQEVPGQVSDRGQATLPDLRPQGDADLFDADIRRRRQLGPVLAVELKREAITLDQFVRSGFRAHAATLSSSSRAKYAWALERHLSELVDEQLRAIDVPRIVAHQHHLLETGRSPATVREVLDLSLGVCRSPPSTG